MYKTTYIVLEKEDKLMKEKKMYHSDKDCNYLSKFEV